MWPGILIDRRDAHQAQGRQIQCPAIAQKGIDIAGQRARAVAAEDFHAFDLILAADRDNLRWLRQHAPVDARAELHLALAWCGVADDEDRALGRMLDVARYH